MCVDVVFGESQLVWSNVSNGGFNEGSEFSDAQVVHFTVVVDGVGRPVCLSFWDSYGPVYCVGSMGNEG